MMTTSGLHPLARDYLARLTAESRALTPEAQGDLVADITEHLTTALRDDAGELEVRNLIERLGTPAELVAAAGPEALAPPFHAADTPGLELASIVALVIGEFLVVRLPGLGLSLWLLGVVLVLASRIWSPGQKALALAVISAGIPLAFLAFVRALAPANDHPAFRLVSAAVVAVLLLTQMLVATKLLRRRG